MLSLIVGANNAPIRLCHNTRSFLIKIGTGRAEPITGDAIAVRFGTAIRDAVSAAPGSWVELDNDPRADSNQPNMADSAEELRLVNDAESLVKLIDTSHPAGELARDIYRRLVARFTSWNELSPSGRVAWLQWRGSDPMAVLQPVTRECVKLNPQAWPDGSMDRRPVA